MTYRELMELYKEGKLDEDQKKKVEYDIERQDVISEYLFNESAIPGFEELNNDDHEKISENEYMNNQQKEAFEFTKIVKATIRKAFIKMGVVVGLIILVIVTVVMSMPNIVNTFYYDPTKVVGEKDGLTTNQISLDMATYSEIFLPGYYRDNVIAEGNGNGEYDINILQSASCTGVFHNVAGKIDKEKMTLYDPNLLERPFANVFLPMGVREIYKNGEEEQYDLGASFFDERATLQELDDKDFYLAYVTFDQVKSYAQLVDWTKETTIEPNWCALSLKDENGEYADEAQLATGFIYLDSCNQLFYDNEAYPYLSVFDVTPSEDIMTKHVLSIYRYMGKQTAFNKMMESEFSEEFYTKIADNVEKNGLHIYGFSVVAKKSELIEIGKAKDVIYMKVEPLR